MGDVSICESCRVLLEQVGKRLPKAHYLVFTRRSVGVELFDSLYLTLEENASDEAVFSEAVDVANMRDCGFFALPIAGYTPLVTKDDLARWQREGRLQKNEAGAFFAKDPIELNVPKTFAMVAEKARIPENMGRGFRSIACPTACRADVDNMALLLGLGLKRTQRGARAPFRFPILSCSRG